MTLPRKCWNDDPTCNCGGFTPDDPPSEYSVDLTPGDVWTEQQLVVVRGLLAAVHRASVSRAAAWDEGWAARREWEKTDKPAQFNPYRTGETL